MIILFFCILLDLHLYIHHQLHLLGRAKYSLSRSTAWLSCGGCGFGAGGIDYFILRKFNTGEIMRSILTTHHHPCQIMCNFFLLLIFYFFEIPFQVD